MGEEAKVRFSESGSQQVVTGFKNVGTAAGSAATNVGQAGNAMKNVGSGMKNTLGSIGQVAGAFATLSLSIVSTWRAYRDLADTQIAVNTSNIKLTNSIQKLNDLKAKQKTLDAQSKKGSVEEQIQTGKIKVAIEALAKQKKAHTITQAAYNLKQAEINKMIADSKGPNAEYLKGEREIADQEEIVANNKLKLGEAIERQNDAQQNFYLSLLPTALSSIGTIATVTSAAKMAIGTGTGGLVGSLGGLGLIIGGLSLGILAYQNNWLGFRDIVGGVITWVKDRLDLWKQGFADVFDLIKKGDWAGAFNRIKEGAAKFWEDLKKTVPFFGGVAKIVDQLMHGNWLGAFNTIKVAAIKFWEDMKKAVPFLASIETVIKQISEGKWEEAFKTIGESIKKGLASLLGADLSEKVILKFQLMKDSGIAQMNLLERGLNDPAKGAIPLINKGLAEIGKGKFVAGFADIGTGVKTGINLITTAINDWVKLNFGIDLKLLNAQANAIGNTILTKIKEGLTFVARTWIDPIVTALLNPETWKAGFLALGGAVVTIGQALWTAIVDAVTGAGESDEDKAARYMRIGTAIWEGITGWFTTNLPDATKAMEGIAQSFVDAVGSTSIFLQNIGIGIWNSIIDGLIAAVPADFGNVIKGWLEKQKVKPVEIPSKLVLKTGAIGSGGTGFQQLNVGAGGDISWKGPPVPVPTTSDNTKLKKTLDAQLNKYMRGHYPIPIDANLSEANKKWQAFVKKVTMTTLQVKIAGSSVNIKKGSQAGAYGGPKKHAQGGMHETLSRNTVIQAHAGERVDIDKPEKMASIGGSKGINVKVFIGNEEFKGYIHTTVNEDQGNSK
jgi:hypothetical protein